jgi:hypothetical protein
VWRVSAGELGGTMEWCSAGVAATTVKRRSRAQIRHERGGKGGNISEGEAWAQMYAVGSVGGTDLLDTKSGE